MAVPEIRSHGFFTFKRPLPEDIPELKTLLTTFFESGEFGRDLSFGELEMQDYLDWFLPRALLDNEKLLYVLEFLPKSTSRTYKPKIIGCCYIALRDSVVAPRRSQSLGVLRLRMINALNDFQVWPNRQAAEVHRRFQRALQTRAQLHQNAGAGGNKAHLLLAVVQEKYRGVGLGTQMVSWAKDVVKGIGCEGLFYAGNVNEVEFMHQCGVSTARMDVVKSNGGITAS